MAIQALSLPLPDESARVEASPEQLDPEAAIGEQLRALRQPGRYPDPGAMGDHTTALII